MIFCMLLKYLHISQLYMIIPHGDMNIYETDMLISQDLCDFPKNFCAKSRIFCATSLIQHSFIKFI